MNDTTSFVFAEANGEGLSNGGHGDGYRKNTGDCIDVEKS